MNPPAGADRSAAATIVSGLLSPALLLDDDGLARLLHYCALLRHPHV